MRVSAIAPVRLWDAWVNLGFPERDGGFLFPPSSQPLHPPMRFFSGKLWELQFCRNVAQRGCGEAESSSPGEQRVGSAAAASYDVRLV